MLSQWNKTTVQFSIFIFVISDQSSKTHSAFISKSAFLRRVRPFPLLLWCSATAACLTSTLRVQQDNMDLVAKTNNYERQLMAILDGGGRFVDLLEACDGNSEIAVDVVLRWSARRRAEDKVRTTEVDSPYYRRLLSKRSQWVTSTMLDSSLFSQK